MIDLKKIQALMQKAPASYPKHVLVNGPAVGMLPDLVIWQSEKGLPMLTLCPKEIDMETIASLKKAAKTFLVHYTVIGKWYDYKGQIVEELKHLASYSMVYDQHFCNLLLNYDPRQKIIDG